MPSRCDILAKRLLDSGHFAVDLDSGAILRRGQRAEVLDKRLGYGRVMVYSKPLTWAMAHRVVWIAAHGMIPDNLEINHINRRRWDNRLANLELVSPTGNQRHWRGQLYDAADPAWLTRLDRGEPAEPATYQPYHTDPRADWSTFC